MKKLIVFSVIFTILAGAVFAQVTVKGGLAGEFVPFQFVSQPDNTKAGGNDGKLPNDDTSYMSMGLGRNGGEQQQGIFSVQGTTENKKAGFRFDLRFRFDGSGTVATVMDSWGGVWFQPASIFRIDAGRFNINSYRGKIGDNWLAKYTAPMKSNNEIFNRVQGNDAVFFTLTPVDGLALGAMINNLSDLGYSRNANSLTTGNQDLWGPARNNKALIKYALEDIQIMAAYTIPDIGMIRAQYIGAHPSVNPYTFSASSGRWNDAFSNPSSIGTFAVDAQRIEAAFNLTAVENLDLDLGFKYWFAVKDSFMLVKPNNGVPTAGGLTVAFPGTTVISSFGGKEPDPKDTTTYQKPTQVSLGAVFKADAITINGRVDGYFGAYIEPKGFTKIEFGPEVWVYLWPTYALSSEVVLGVDVGFDIFGDVKSDGNVMAKGGTAFGFGAYVRYNIAPGAFIQGGLAYSGGSIWGNADEAKKLNTLFTIPIGFEVSL